ncbi:MAG: CPBP family intramembrane metalloprotease [Limnochordaceae bacterium]|nr:CPBP family intramembrane metalloprotease [Limnochordaceae bacterium]
MARSLLAGFALGAAAMAAVAAVQAGFGWIRVERATGPSAAPPASRALGAVLLVAAAALAEEWLFRGLLLSFLRRYVGSAAAIAVSSLLFGLAHLPNARLGASQATVPLQQATGFVTACVSGWAFSAMVLRTGGLSMAVGAHLAWNLVQWPVLGFPLYAASRLEPLLVGLLPPHWRVRPAGPWWWSGGVYGAEASILAVLAWLALALGIGIAS